MTDREHIFVSIPTMENRVVATMLPFVVALEQMNAHPGSPWKFTFWSCNGFQPVEYARNMIVGKFLETDATRLWFLDSDMLPDESTFQILSVDADVAAGRMYRFAHMMPGRNETACVSFCAYRETETPWIYKPIIPRNGDSIVQDVDAVGAGSMCIRRTVLEDPRMRLDTRYVLPDGSDADTEDEKGTEAYAPAIFRTQRRPNGRMILGEDLDFCRRAKRCGYSIKVHLGAKVGHFKPIELDQLVNVSFQAVDRIAPGRQHEILGAANG